MFVTGWRSTSGFLGNTDRTDALLRKVKEQGSASFDELRTFVQNEQEEPDNRYRAILSLMELHSLGDLESTRVIPVLETLINTTAHKEYDINRQDALYALGLLDHGAGVEKLIEFLHKPDLSEKVRGEVLEALGKSRNPLAVKFLASGILDFRDGTVRRIISEDLWNIEGVDWQKKADEFIGLLRNSTKRRGEIDSRAILAAIRPADGEWAGHIRDWSIILLVRRLTKMTV